jgi:hypothetical protein
MFRKGKKMKNLKYAFALLAALSVLLSACSQPAQPSTAPSASAAVETGTPEPSATETAAEPAALAEDDIAFALDGAQYRIKTDIQPLLSALGPDYVLDAAPSCLFTGEDKTFTYPDVLITTNPIDGKDIIDEIDLTSNKYATARGIRVGDTVEQVKAAYGDNCTDDGYIVTYFLSGVKDDLKSPQLYFVITDGKVETIGFYGASNING